MFGRPEENISVCQLVKYDPIWYLVKRRYEAVPTFGPSLLALTTRKLASQIRRTRTLEYEAEGATIAMLCESFSR